MPLLLKLSQPRTKKVGAQITILIRVLAKIAKYDGDSEIQFDFTRIQFVQPIFLASISALIMRLRAAGYKVSLTNTQKNITAHFKTIYFPNGLKLDQRKNWEKKLNSYLGKDYIPLIYFQARPLKRESLLRDNILSLVFTLLSDNCALPHNVRTGVSYLISEMTDNIVDHSGQHRGWITAHYNPFSKYLEVCLVDSGHGLLQTYLNDGVKIATHADAILQALLGLSTKGKERGFGIHTSNNMIVKGLKGVFVILTGNSMLIDNKIINLPVTWKGTIVVLRIPITAENFNYIKYVE